MYLETLFTLSITAIVVIGLIACVRFHHEFVVQEGTFGILFHQGRLSVALPPGRHIRWGRHFHLLSLEARRTLLQVAGQEVLTADNVTVKLSLVLTTQIVDATKALQSADNYQVHVYSAAQTALRTVVAGVTMEALLNQRAAIGGQLLELIGPKADTVGVKVHEAEVRDVMLPGDLRKAFSEVLKVKQEAQTALERARGESAALRSLANAARLVEGVPSLATLRFLQTLESSNAGQTFVMNDLSAILPALRARNGHAPSVDETQT